MEKTTLALIRKDIFVAVISNGSLVQKENWQATCDAAAEWVLKSDTPVTPAPVKRTRKKVDTAQAPKSE